ncbi:hypothetical protein B0H65DRAFT_471462 [Neurospora tetraspora]|uniref:Uncharacterized protein n=1 Tax=Neurospora tetraspora TaxID=94610 RepID=A0AAE0MPG7_9PEZI|nr:hypothetical protein B0H65DRAFT_471462 [Neurospora tetraspora]
MLKHFTVGIELLETKHAGIVIRVRVEPSDIPSSFLFELPCFLQLLPMSLFLLSCLLLLLLFPGLCKLFELLQLLEHPFLLLFFCPAIFLQ